MTVCPKCQHQQAGGQECQACGLIFARYKGAQTTPVETAFSRSETLDEPRPSAFWRAFRIARWVWLGITAVAVLLMMLVPGAPAIDVNDRALDTAQAKIRLALQASDSRVPYGLKLNEAEINAILDFGLQNATGADREAISSVQDIRVTISDNRLHLYFLVNRFGKNLALSLSGRPRLEDSYFRLRAESGWIGYCPMVPFVLNFALDRAMDWGSQRDQLKMSPAVKAIEIRDNELAILYNYSGQEGQPSEAPEMTTLGNPVLVPPQGAPAAPGRNQVLSSPTAHRW